jgi:hypothetical protein
VSPRLISALVALFAAALTVDLFFDWTEGGGDLDIGARTGLDSALGFWCFGACVALVLWEVVGALGVARTARADSLVAFFLAAGSAVAGIGSVIQIKWSAPSAFGSDLAIAAVLAIPLSMLLLAGAAAHLALHFLARQPSVR